MHKRSLSKVTQVAHSSKIHPHTHKTVSEMLERDWLAASSWIQSHFVFIKHSIHSVFQFRETDIRMDGWYMNTCPGAWKFARSISDKTNNCGKLLPCLFSAVINTTPQFRCLSVVIHSCEWDLRHLRALELCHPRYDAC